MRAILVLMFAVWAAVPALATVAQYEVRGVRSNDTLNVRSAPAHTARIVGRIPHNGREIEIIDRGRGQWVKISYGRVRGFVNRRYLALSKRRAAEVKPAPVMAAKAEAANVEEVPAAVAVDPSAIETPAAPETPVVPVAPVVAPVSAQAEPTAPVPPMQKLAAPSAPDTSLPGSKQEGDETPPLMKPPVEMMPETVHLVPSRLSCSGVEPTWSMTTSSNVGEFVTRKGEKVRLEFSQLVPATGRSAVWMAEGRAAASRLNLHVAQTGTCRTPANEQAFPYEVTLRLDDGQIVNGCCQKADE